MASAYEKMDIEQLDAEIANLEAQVARYQQAHLSFDMTRGKPAPEQTELSRPMLDLLNSNTELSGKNWSAANYGCPEGLPQAKELAADILGVDPSCVIVSGSSSVHLMHDLVCDGFSCGVAGQDPWYKQGEVKWLCPSPGYDRHFRITARYGIKNVPVEMGPDGPDMDEITRLVESDPTVKGIWCVPKYSNPTGITYSDEVVRRFAHLHPAAADFRIYWDNAYIVHDLYDKPDELLDIFSALREAGAHNLVYEFASTSKVTFPGSGMSWVAASPSDIAEIKSTFGVEQVCPEKMTELAHVLFLKDLKGVHAHMKKHAEIIRPRFELVESKLQEGLGDLGIASWSHPRGGYFFSFEGPERSAKRIVALAANLGVKITPAGSTWPGGKDPRDTNIRIAPTYLALADLGVALDVFVVATKLVSARLAREARA